MAINTYSATLLKGTIESVKSIIPDSLDIMKPSIIQQSLLLVKLGVLIELSGTINGRIIIDGNESTFSNIGEVIYGMSLQGEL